MADEVKAPELLRGKYLELVWEESKDANQADYLGSTLLGFQKQNSLDLAYLKAASGLPVALKPSTWDAEIPLRGEFNFKARETEMPLFREGSQITEKDWRLIKMFESTVDNPFLKDAITRQYDKAIGLIKGAKVIPEIMTWQLLAPTDGKPRIKIADNDTSYDYDYDPSGEWYANNFIDVSSTPWSAAATSKPIANLSDAVDIAAARGATPRYAIMSKKTMAEMMNSAEVKSAALSQNLTPNVYMTEKVARSVIEELTGVQPIVYNAIYAGSDGKAKKFYPDGVVTLIPEGLLGNMVYAATAEEFDNVCNKSMDVAIIDNSIALTVAPTSFAPKRYAIYASEVVLPSYERADEVYELKVDADPTEE